MLCTQTDILAAFDNVPRYESEGDVFGVDTLSTDNAVLTYAALVIAAADADELAISVLLGPHITFGQLWPSPPTTPSRYSTSPVCCDALTCRSQRWMPLFSVHRSWSLAWSGTVAYHGRSHDERPGAAAAQATISVMFVRKGHQRVIARGEGYFAEGFWRPPAFLACRGPVTCAHR